MTDYRMSSVINKENDIRTWAGSVKAELQSQMSCESKGNGVEEDRKKEERMYVRRRKGEGRKEN